MHHTGIVMLIFLKSCRKVDLGHNMSLVLVLPLVTETEAVLLSAWVSVGDDVLLVLRPNPRQVGGGLNIQIECFHRVSLSIPLSIRADVKWSSDA